MYDDELPEFKKMKMPRVTTFIHGALAGNMVRLEEFDDHHFRVTFKASYFQLADGTDEPSKSQWNTLKKKIKRRDRSVFIFREYGQIACDDAGSEPCLYLDFGFLYM
jgi:hypothetical protein